jgi:hypothetical protein
MKKLSKKSILIVILLLTAITLLVFFFKHEEVPPKETTEEKKDYTLRMLAEKDDFSEYDDIKESFGIDEYVFDWEGDRYYEDFFRVKPYIDKPTKYFVDEHIAWEQSWTLKSGYVLSVFCEKFGPDQIVPGMYNSCRLTYNNQDIKDNLRYWVFCPDDGKGCKGALNFQVLSPDHEDYEFLILGEYAQGSYDDAYVYSLQDGQAKLIPFQGNGEEKESWFVNHPINLRIFEKDKDFKLITIYQNFATAELYIYHIWDIVDNSFVLDKTVGHFWEDSWNDTVQR